jgi:hypothetical protein
VSRSSEFTRTVLTLVLLAVAVKVFRPPVCNDWGGYGGYDDGENWGYKDWFCDLPRGHRGDHWARA